MNIYDYEDALLGRVAKDELKNKTFCFTGKCARSRQELETMALNVGAIPKQTVTKKLNYLVIPASFFYSETSKHYTAKQYGVKVITETEFVAMVG
jgi:NAD-dependent DNA ligase